MSSTDIYPKEIPSIIEDRRFYVYVYFDPFTKEPFYVGKGTGKRAWVHLYPTSLNRDTNTHKKNKIKEILRLGVVPIVRIVKDNLTEMEAYSHEASLIAHYGRAWCGSGCLTNIREGFGGLSSQPTGFRDKTPYEFRNIESGLVVKKNMDDMVAFLNTTPDRIRSLVNGSIKTSRGWCLDSTTEEELKPKLTDTTVYDLTNLTTKETRSVTQNEMIHDLGMSPAGASILANGKGFQSNQWCLTENYKEGLNANAIGMKYWFNNPELGLVVYKTQSDLYKQYGISPSEVCEVVKGRKLSCYGWMLGQSPHPRYTPKDKNNYTIVHYMGERFTGRYDDVVAHVGSYKIKSVIERKRNHANGWFCDFITEDKLKGFRIDGHDPFKYRFSNIKTGEEFVITRKEFCEMVDTNPKKLDKMFNHGYTYDGTWQCIENRVGYVIPV